MKIAYLITAYNNYEHLEKLINALDDTNAEFFVHIDKKSQMPENLVGNLKVVFIDRIPVWWGGWSHMEAILNLMKEAGQRAFDYYVLISGTDYPIRPNSFLYNTLKEGGEYINIIKGFQDHKPESRIKYYYYDSFDRRNRQSIRTVFFSALEKVKSKIIIKRKYPFKEIFHGSTWWALSHDCVNHILDFIKNNPQYVRFYKTSWCAEESFLQTIIGNSKFATECKTNLTYADWSKEPGPIVLNQEHVALFKKQDEFESSYGKYRPFFARKFNDTTKDVVEMIDRELRTEKP